MWRARHKRKTGVTSSQTPFTFPLLVLCLCLSFCFANYFVFRKQLSKAKKPQTYTKLSLTSEASVCAPVGAFAAIRHAPTGEQILARHTDDIFSLNTPKVLLSNALKSARASQTTSNCLFLCLFRRRRQFNCQTTTKQNQLQLKLKLYLQPTSSKLESKAAKSSARLLVTATIKIDPPTRRLICGAFSIGC